MLAIGQFRSIDWSRAILAVALSFAMVATDLEMYKRAAIAESQVIGHATHALEDQACEHHTLTGAPQCTSDADSH